MNTIIKSIYKGFSKPINIPYTIVQFACGHSVEMIYRDQRSNRHSPDNWLMQAGEEINCAKCDENSKAIQQIITFAKTPEYSHTTLRDLTASKTGEWMAFCVYRIDHSSPTQCNLAMSVEATPETEK